MNSCGGRNVVSGGLGVLGSVVIAAAAVAAVLIVAVCSCVTEEEQLRDLCNQSCCQHTGREVASAMLLEGSECATTRISRSALVLMLRKMANSSGKVYSLDNCQMSFPYLLPCIAHAFMVLRCHIHPPNRCVLAETLKNMQTNKGNLRLNRHCVSRRQQCISRPPPPPPPSSHLPHLYPPPNQPPATPLHGSQPPPSSSPPHQPPPQDAPPRSRPH